MGPSKESTRNIIIVKKDHNYDAGYNSVSRGEFHNTGNGPGHESIITSPSTLPLIQSGGSAIMDHVNSTAQPGNVNDRLHGGDTANETLAMDLGQGDT